MSIKPHVKLLKSMYACEEAVEFADSCPSLKKVWETCNRSDWMIWLLTHIGFYDPKTIRLYACWCVRNTPLSDGRVVWDLLSDERFKNVVIVAERDACGGATEQTRTIAGDMAEAASRAVEVAWVASRARDSSRAVEAAARAASAASGDSSRAVEAALWAVEAARAASGAASGDASRARAASRAAQANQLRAMIHYSVVAKLMAAQRRINA